jgi:hypothetical protein
VLIVGKYIGGYDTQTITMPCPNETVTNTDLISETLILLDTSLNDLPKPLDGPESDNEVMSDVDSVSHHNKDMDSDFELDRAFGLGENNDPFLEEDQAMFLEMFANSGLSGVLLLI